MRELEPILTKAESTKEQWSRACHRLFELSGVNGQRFARDLQLPGVGWSAVDLNARILRTFDLLAGLQRISIDALLASTMVSDFASSLDHLAVGIQEVSNQVVNIDANGGPGQIAPDGFVISSANGTTSAHFGKLLRNVANQLDAFLPTYYRIAGALPSTVATPPQNILSEALRVLREAEEIASEMREVQAGLAQAQAEVSRLRTEAEAARNEAERLKVEAELSRKSIGEYEANATQKLAGIQAASTEAERLQSAVKAYQPDFERFQTELNQRFEWFAKAKQEEDALIERLTNKESDIGRINESAEGMLKGATVAGLASSFGDIRDKITVELTWARRGFYVAVTLLFLSVLPLAVYVIPGLSLFGLLRGDTSVADFELGQVLIRALLLIPFAWLAKFAAARHATLFRLREHYAYKYSIASSVDGFKKQAPSLQDEIAAAAFKELTFNPADRMDARSPESDHPNPVVDWIMRKLGATHDGKNS